ncbi:hypothetical protein B0H16DRAFT_279587 [Mycena metata]|uniref:Uncharacterized protein n=1 Tax=Mycena metata TaxID=1033252 RepID=A0AAD7HRK1_9AGAR|nr:hypothetical protein B0H16DRAFT_279587 [Mycena metata]
MSSLVWPKHPRPLLSANVAQTQMYTPLTSTGKHRCPCIEWCDRSVCTMHLREFILGRTLPPHMVALESCGTHLRKHARDSRAGRGRYPSINLSLIPWAPRILVVHNSAVRVCGSQVTHHPLSALAADHAISIFALHFDDNAVLAYQDQRVDCTALLRLNHCEWACGYSVRFSSGSVSTYLPTFTRVHEFRTRGTHTVGFHLTFLDPLLARPTGAPLSKHPCRHTEELEAGPTLPCRLHAVV